MGGMQVLTDRAQAHRVSRTEFERLRDGRPDAARYELLDGVVLVTPSPRPGHQEVVTELIVRLRNLIPVQWALLPGPVDVDLFGDGETVLIPDLLLADRAHLTETNHAGPPILVVEVLSPTTWHRDLGDKMAAYARATVRHYWVIAPDIPSITIYQLGADGRYAELAHVEGEQPVHLTEPVDLVLRAVDLVARHHA